MRSQPLCAAALTIAIVAPVCSKANTDRLPASTTSNGVGYPQPTNATDETASQATGSNEVAANGNAEVNANAVSAVRENLIGKAMFDGSPVTGVRSRDTCKTVIVTSRGATVIDWSHVGNLAPRTGGGQDTTAIDVGGKPHALSVPSGDLTDQVNMSLGVLALNCGGGM